MDLGLQGRAAIVCAASQGLGRAAAAGLAAEGVRLLICSRDRERIEAAAREIAAEAAARLPSVTPEVIPLAADVSRAEDIHRLVELARERFGRIDILVNNAGLIRRAPATEYSDEDWDLLLEVNLSAPFRLSRRVGKLMIEQGGGRIVNIASLLAFQGGILVPAYSASKGGVAQFTKALANEWACKNVNVNAIAPGYIATNNTAALRADETRSRQILERIPAGRWGTPEDIAGAAVFLCSEAARYVTGHVLAVDGGWLAR